MSNSMTSAQQIMQGRWLLLPEALLVFHCNRTCHLCISGLLILRVRLRGYRRAVWRSGGGGPGSLGARVQLGQQWELPVLRLRSCFCPRGAAWQPQQQLENFIRKLCFLKPRSASVLCFAAECLPRMFSGSTCLIRCKRPAHLPRAGNLLMLTEKAAPVRLGPFGALPWGSCGSPAAQRGKQNFHVVFLFNSQGKAFRKILSVWIVKSDVQPKNSISVRAESVYNELTGGTEVGKSTLLNISKTNFPHQVSSSFSLCCLNRNVKRNC